MAQAFKMASDKKWTKRSILFMPCFPGERQGMLGSEYYSKNPVNFPLDQHGPT